MTTAVVFPGQGSQRRGMGRQLFETCEDLVREADSILGYSMRELCLEDPDKKLNDTRYTQPALYTVNAMAWEDAKAKGESSPACLAGHSLGEYNALAAAGVFDFATGLRLVKKRGALMAGAENGAMAAVIGPDTDRVRAGLEAGGISGVWVANLNTPTQTVISGSRRGIEAAKPVFDGMAGTRYLILNVSGAFHSPLMEAAAKEFEDYAAGFEFNAPEIPVVSNVLAGPYPREGAGELLCRQMTHPVLWMDSIRYMAESGVTDFVETGPGRVLTNMVKAILGPPAP